MALKVTDPLTEMSTKNLPGRGGLRLKCGQPALKSNTSNTLTAICVLIIKNGKPQPCGPLAGRS
jgi:hypothetical protein